MCDEFLKNVVTLWKQAGIIGFNIHHGDTIDGQQLMIIIKLMINR